MDFEGIIIRGQDTVIFEDLFYKVIDGQRVSWTTGAEYLAQLEWSKKIFESWTQAMIWGPTDPTKILKINP